MYGDKDMLKLSRTDVFALINTLKNKYDSGYVFNIMTILKGFLKYYYPKEVDINPDLIRPKRKIVETPFVTEDDVDYLCEFIDERTFAGVRNKAMIKMMFRCGARVSEILSIRLSDLIPNPEEENKKPEAVVQEVIIKNKKNDDSRPIRWDDEAHEVFLKYLALRVSKDYKSEYLFLNKNGTSLTVRGVQHMLTKLAKVSDIGKNITPHMLRHGFAHYQLFEKGANTKEVGSMLGHSANNPMSAMYYLRFNFMEKRRVFRKYV